MKKSRGVTQPAQVLEEVPEDALPREAGSRSWSWFSSHGSVQYLDAAQVVGGAEYPLKYSLDTRDHCINPGEVVEVVLFASARGAFNYFIRAEPALYLEPLIGSSGASVVGVLDVDGPSAPPAADADRRWFPIWTSGVFRAKEGSSGRFFFKPFVMPLRDGCPFALSCVSVMAKVIHAP